MQHILFTFLIFIFRDHNQIYPAHRRQMIDLPVYHFRRHESRHVILFILSFKLQRDLILCDGVFLDILVGRNLMSEKT